MRADAMDRREKSVVVTERGVAVIGLMTPLARTIDSRIGADLTVEDIVICKHVLLRVMKNLKQDDREMTGHSGGTADDRNL